jgi:hypothetical protein
MRWGVLAMGILSENAFTDSAARKLNRHWKSHGLRIAPGGSQKSVRKFESRYSVILPKDLREYFLTLDGMIDQLGSECDREGFGFYSLSRVKNICEEYASLKMKRPILPTISNPENYFVFVDYLQWCWAYAIRLSNNLSESNEVIHVGTVEPKVIAQSFSEFVDLYLKDARDLYPG